MKKSKYFYILVAGFVLWVIETAAFGFNAKPESGLEGFLDTVATIMMLYGVVGDLLTNVEIHKHSNYYKYKETNIKTRNVEVKGERPTVNYHFGTSKEETQELLANKPKKD